VILLFAFVWLSIACWSFFLFVSFLFSFLSCYIRVGVVNALIKGEIEDHVWTDSWLSIAGAGCGLTGVGAGEEQARKVVADEASRCGEDK
jgi:hypothetical protein